MKNIKNTQIAKEVIEVPVEDFLHDVYLPFSHYVIQSRALVAADGLKAVNRRILFSAFNDGLTPGQPFAKASSLAAQVMREHHPHGNTSIEDALARMAQGFNQRVPLIDPYGIVGEVNGDVASAARYWEARLTKAGLELVKEVKDGSVEMGKNFDGTLDEPAMLPIRWPNAIVNGTEGIAVGYASSLPSHNPDEVMDAIIARIKNPKLSIDKLMEIMPAPDLPSGGELIMGDGIREYYETGKGSYTVRAKYTIEKLPRGKSVIHVHELPYQVSPMKIIEEWKAAKSKDLLKEVFNIKNLSDGKKGLNLKIELKAGANTLLVLSELFKHTKMEQKFSVNSTVLHDGKPILTTMPELIDQFIKFRTACIKRRSETRLGSLDAKIHKAEGILAVLLDIDKAIKIIRNADTIELAKEQLMKKFKIDDSQATHILGMQLRQLTKSDSVALKAKKDEYKKEQQVLKEILTCPKAFKAQMIKELKETKKIITSERRTTISEKTVEDIKAEVKNIKKTVKSTAKASTLSLTVLAGNRLHISKENVTEFKDGKKDIPAKYSINIDSKSDILAITKSGFAYKVPMKHLSTDEVLDYSMTGILEHNEIIGLSSSKSSLGTLIATRKGEITIIKGSVVSDQSTFVNLKDDEIVFAKMLEESDMTKNLLMASNQGVVTAFPVSQVRSARPGAGTVKGMVLDNAHLTNAAICEPHEILVSVATDSIKLTSLEEVPVKSRGTKGVINHKLAKNTEVVDIMTGSESSLLIMNAMKKVKLPEITKRAVSGTKSATSGLITGVKK